MPANPLATPEEAIEVLGEMVGEHRRRMALGRVRTKVGVHPARFAYIAGLNSRAHALAEASLPLWDSPTAQVACVPLARAAFECGLLAQWVSRDDEALAAVIAEHERQERAFAEDIAKVPYLAPLAQRINDGLQGATSPKAHIAKSIRSLAHQFQGGDVIYAHYRLLCRYTHAGIPASEQWLEAADEGSSIPFTLRAFREPERAFVVFFGWALLYTASAYGDMIQAGSRYNNSLNRWAFRMGIDRRLLRATSGLANAHASHQDDG